jgi:hypothetical protein
MCLREDGGLTYLTHMLRMRSIKPSDMIVYIPKQVSSHCQSRIGTEENQFLVITYSNLLVGFDTLSGTVNMSVMVTIMLL